MKTLRSVLVFSTTVTLAGMSLQAATLLTANMTNAQEAPPAVPTTSTGAPRPASFGTANFVLNDAMTAMSMTATVFNIDITGTQTPDVNDNLTAAHIHASATGGTPTFGVVWGFFGLPDNDNNPDNLVVTPFATGVGGTFTSVWNAPEGNGGTTLALQIPNILAGRSYINFHTTQFGGGEIRGTLVGVPESGATALLFLSALIPLEVLRRKLSSRRVVGLGIAAGEFFVKEPR